MRTGMQSGEATKVETTREEIRTPGTETAQIAGTMYDTTTEEGMGTRTTIIGDTPEKPCTETYGMEAPDRTTTYATNLLKIDSR